MPFTGDAYPHVSTATGGSILKTALIASNGGQEVLADRLLVKFLPSTSAADGADVHTQARARLNMAARPGQLTATTYLVDVTGATSVADAATVYKADPRVTGAGPDTIAAVNETPNDPRLRRAVEHDQDPGSGRLEPHAWRCRRRTDCGARQRDR